jgi:hypothetical protein
MKSDAISEIIFNTLKHEFQNATETRLLELAEQLQAARTEKLRRSFREARGSLPPVSKQKLSKTVLRSLRAARTASAA